MERWNFNRLGVSAPGANWWIPGQAKSSHSFARMLEDASRLAGWRSNRPTAAKFDPAKLGVPSALFMQCHFDYFNADGLKPYAGAGINYTRFSPVHLPAGVGIDKNSWGLALRLGVDIPPGSKLYFNRDVKKIYLDTEVSAGGAKPGTFNIDPVLFGVGPGWRF